MKTDIEIMFSTDGHICDCGQKTITGHVKTMLVDTLYKRTYFHSIVEGKPYKDQYETSDARTYFQCALVCAVKREYREALEWYTVGSRFFTDTAVLFSNSHDVQCDYNHYTECYDIQVNAWINTLYGSKQELIKIGDLPVFDPHHSDMTGHDVIDRVNVLKEEWFALIKKHKDQEAANKAALAEFSKGLEYTKE
jgi:hypothetical protein